MAKLKFNPTSGRFDYVLNKAREFDFYLSAWNTATLNLYVNASTGSDSNDGLSAGNPFLTIGAAIDRVPLAMGGITQINIATGTYTVTSQTIGLYLAASGNSDNKTVIKFVGDTVTPSNVIIKPSATSQNIFTIIGRNLLVDFDGIRFQDCTTAITVTNGYVVLRGVDFVNYRGAGGIVNVSLGSLVQFSNTSIGGTFTADSTSSSAGGILIQSFSRVEMNRPTFTVTGFRAAAINCSTFGQYARGTTNTTTTLTAGASSSRFGIFASTFANVLLGGSININDVTTTSTAGYGAIRGLQNSFFNIVGGSTFTFTNCAKGFSFDPASMYTEGSLCTYNFNSVTTPIEISHGAVCNTVNAFSSGAVTYVETGISSSIDQILFGYDHRYQVSRSAGNVASANAFVLSYPENFYVVTGTTQINALVTDTNWVSGKTIYLKFTDVLTVKHNTSGGAGTAVMFLEGSVDLTTANNMILGFVYDGTQWQQTSLKTP